MASLFGAALLVASCGQVSPLDRTTAPNVASSSAGATASLVAGASPRQPEIPTAAPTTNARAIGVRVSGVRLPAARSRSVAAAVGARILVIGGLTRSGTTGSILAIDVGAGTVRPAGSLIAPVHDAGGAALGGAFLVIGGGRVVPGASVQRVAPNGKTTQLGRLPAPRADLVAVSVGNQLLVVGGGTAGGPDGRVLVTSDGRHFRTLARLAVGVRYPAVALLGGIVYVVGGSTTSGDTNVIQVIDPRTGRVRVIGHMPKPLSHAGAVVVGGLFLVAGGRSAGRAQDGLWQLDPSVGTAKRVGRLPYAVSDMAAVVANGNGYLIGGESSRALATVVEISLR